MPTTQSVRTTEKDDYGSQDPGNKEQKWMDGSNFVLGKHCSRISQMYSQIRLLIFLGLLLRPKGQL